MSDNVLSPRSIRDFNRGIIREVDTPLAPEDSVDIAINAHFDRLPLVTRRLGISLLGNQIASSTPSLAKNSDADPETSTVDGIVSRTSTTSRPMTATFFPDEDTESTSMDARTGRQGSSESYSAIQSGAGTLASDTTSNDQFAAIRASSVSNQYDLLQRGIFLFDTSALPDTASVASAVNYFYVSGKSDQLGGNGGFTVVSSTPASNTSVVAADYSTLGTTAYSSAVSIASITTGKFNSVSLNASGVSAISLTSITKLGTRIELDRTGSSPTWGSAQVQSVTGDYAEGSNPPIMRVTYTDGSPSIGFPATSTLSEYSSIVSRFPLDEKKGMRTDIVSSNHLTDGNTVLTGTGYTNGSSGADFVRAADFEQSNSEYLAITNGSQSGLNITGSLTMSAWIKLESTSVTGTIGGKWETSSNRRQYVAKVNTSGNVTFSVSSDGSSSATVTGGTSLSTGTWYFVTVVFTASTSIEIYINGVSDGSSTSSIPSSLYSSSGSFFIGYNSLGASSTEFFDGLIQDFTVWNTSLSSTEVSDLYDLYTTSPSSTFSGIRDGSGTSASDSDTSAKAVLLSATTSTDKYSQMNRGVLTFDTSSIPDSASISSATLRVYVNSKSETIGSQSMGVVAGMSASNTALASNDYSNQGLTRYASDITLAALTTTANNTYTLNSTGISGINKNGITKLSLRLSSDIDNSAPTWVSGGEASVNIDFAEGSNPPLLTVTYTVGSNILGLHQFIDTPPGTDSQLVVKASDTIYRLNGSTWTSIDATRSSTEKERFVNALDYMFYTNKTDGMKTYNGSTVGTTNAVNAPAAEFLEYYKNLVYAVSTTQYADIVYTSSLPTIAGAITWDTTNDYFRVTSGDGEGITGVKRWGAELLFFKRNSLFRHFGVGVDPDPLYNIGTYSHESIVPTQDGLYFHAPPGIFVYQGGKPQLISRPIDDFMRNVSRSNFTEIAGWNDSDHIYHSLGDITIGGVTFSNVVSSHTISSQVWTLYSYSVRILRGINYDTGTSIEQVVGDTDSNVYQFNTGNSDNGADIFYLLRTRYIEFGGLISNTATITSLAAICEKADGGTLSWQRDDEDQNTWHSIAELTKFVWISGSNFRINGHRIRFQLSGSSKNDPWIFNGIEILSGVLNIIQPNA